MSQTQHLGFTNQPFFLFTSSKSGLMHNNIFETLVICFEALQEFLMDEGLSHEESKHLNLSKIIIHLIDNDDYIFYLSNGSWFHIQVKM